MPEKKLLVFPPPRRILRTKQGPRPRTRDEAKFQIPSYQRQTERVSPRFDEIERAFEARRMELLNDPSGTTPEQVLVLETIGSVEKFVTVVKNVQGLEWLGEWDEDDIQDDDDFYDKRDISSGFFRKSEFTADSIITDLCNALLRDGYESDTESRLYSIKWLNDTLKSPTLFATVTTHRSSQLPSERLISLKNEYDRTNGETDLRNLNRLLLEAFYPQLTPKSQTDRHTALSGRLYLVMTNQQAMTELISLWRRYAADHSADLGLGRTELKKVFEQLKDIRPWDVKDRLLETGVIDDWKERIATGQETLRFEIELWYRQSDPTRSQNRGIIERELRANGGSFIKESVIKEIRYHGILATLPQQAIQGIIDNPNVSLVRCDQVMFFRPTGQCLSIAPADAISLSTGTAISEQALPQGVPIAALLDGLPLENHELLSGRLIIDDPDNWAAMYPAHERIHGTAMASLIAHDELDAGATPLRSPIYVRPIMKPDTRDFNGSRIESVPDDELPVDLIHRSVMRLFESGDGLGFSSVRVINLSICDRNRHFDRMLSPLAKLLDWLSWKYKVLFIVSAGNHSEDIELEEPRTRSISSIAPDDLQRLTLKSMAKSAFSRRIMSPAESINSLTVASLHSDLCNSFVSGNRVNPLAANTLPSPFNPVGLGFRRAIKPDVLCRGGRQFYSERLGTIHQFAALQVSNSNAAPGQKVAAPMGGGISGLRYSCGTSNSAALTTRLAAQLHDVIATLQFPGEDLTNDTVTVLMKTLVTHSSLYGESDSLLEEAISDFAQPGKMKEYLHRFLGYGIINPDRVISCTNQRATLIGCGTITKDNAVIYSVPLPSGLSSRNDFRRLTITLAWLSPINTMQRKYRKASLTFTPNNKDLLKVDREDYYYYAVRRGTVQHEVFEGQKATPFADNDSLEILIECKEDAGILNETVPYAIAATLEVAEGIDILIYEEIQQRLQTFVPIQPRA